ncbi:MAG: DUF4202 domain-containing protein, partial [Phycisphaeraceae bacterium]
DPRSETFQGEPWPKELLYGHRMSRWLEVLRPDAPEPLRLAARAQHIRRWEVPRDSYPRDRKGYHQWRTRLYGYHADRTEEILAELGYDAAIIARVRDLLMKKRIKNDPDMQTLEDVICLVFLENYFADFAREHDEAKLMTILQRTWGKMSEQGHHAALRLDLPDEARALVEKALAGG